MSSALFMTTPDGRELLRGQRGVLLLPRLLAYLAHPLSLLLRVQGRITAHGRDLRVRILLNGPMALHYGWRNTGLLPAGLMASAPGRGGAGGSGATRERSSLSHKGASSKKSQKHGPHQRLSHLHGEPSKLPLTPVLGKSFPRAETESEHPDCTAVGPEVDHVTGLHAIFMWVGCDWRNAAVLRLPTP